MTFRVGQKVVCVDAALGIYGIPEPDKGDICTVTNIYSDPCGLVLELLEFPTDARDPLAYGPGWFAESFRPIVERKTDIGFAHEILRKATRKNRVRA